MKVASYVAPGISGGDGTVVIIKVFESVARKRKPFCAFVCPLCAFVVKILKNDFIPDLVWFFQPGGGH